MSPFGAFVEEREGGRGDDDGLGLTSPCVDFLSLYGIQIISDVSPLFPPRGCHGMRRSPREVSPKENSQAVVSLALACSCMSPELAHTTPFCDSIHHDMTTWSCRPRPSSPWPLLPDRDIRGFLSYTPDPKIWMKNCQMCGETGRNWIYYREWSKKDIWHGCQNRQKMLRCPWVDIFVDPTVMSVSGWPRGWLM